MALAPVYLRVYKYGVFNRVAILFNLCVNYLLGAE